MTRTELEEQLDADLNLSEENITATCLSLGRVYQKYLRVLMAEKVKYDNLEQERIDLYKKLFHQLQIKGYDGYQVGKTKSEVEVYINMNETYREVSKKLAKVQHNIEYIDKTLDNINKISFNIKNFIDAQKLKLGMI